MKFINKIYLPFVVILIIFTLFEYSNCKEFDFSEHPNLQVLNSNSLNSFISQNKPSIVLYYGKNKDSDKVIQNVFLKVVDEYYEDQNEDVAFGIINVDTEPKVRNTHFLDSTTPTIIYYNEKGVEVSEFLEKKTKSSLEKFIKNPNSPIKLSNGPGSWSQIESQVAHLNSRNFTSYLNNNENVLVMFFTSGCGHCTRMKPAYAEASQIAIKKKIGNLAAVDCGVSSKVCEKFKIEGFPTLILFKNGKNTDKYGGDRSVDSLVEFLEKSSTTTNNNNNNLNIKKNKKVKNEL